MATLGYYPQTTTTAGQYFSMATLGYYPQPTINAIDEIAALKQQFRRQVQQTKQPKQNHVQRPASPPRRNSNPITRGHLSESHLAISSIVFVPSKDPSKKNCACVIPNCQRRHLDDKGYNHPAVVLDIRDERSIGGELTALCCIISADPQPNPQEPASEFTLTQIPKGNAAAPATAPNGATILYLEPESTMYKKSHICDSHIYAIPVSQLTAFGKPHQNRLTKESYQALIANFPSLTPQNWIKTAKLAAGERDPTTFPSPRPAPIPIRQGPVIGYAPEELLTTRPNADRRICAHINNVVEVHSHRTKRTASVSNALPPKRSKLQDTVNELLKLDIPMESLVAMAPELFELLN